MYFGTAKTPLSCVWDLGSDWVVAQSTSCTNCKGYKFNPATSGTQISPTLQNLTYGSATVWGTYYTDTVCATTSSSTCVSGFKYFSATKQTGLNAPVNGLVGLSQYKTPLLNPTTTRTAGQSYI